MWDVHGACDVQQHYVQHYLHGAHARRTWCTGTMCLDIRAVYMLPMQHANGADAPCDACTCCMHPRQSYVNYFICFCSPLCRLFEFRVPGDTVCFMLENVIITCVLLYRRAAGEGDSKNPRWGLMASRFLVLHLLTVLAASC